MVEMKSNIFLYYSEKKLWKLTFFNVGIAATTTIFEVESNPRAKHWLFAI